MTPRKMTIPEAGDQGRKGGRRAEDNTVMAENSDDGTRSWSLLGTESMPAIFLDSFHFWGVERMELRRASGRGLIGQYDTATKLLNSPITTSVVNFEWSMQRRDANFPKSLVESIPGR